MTRILALFLFLGFFCAPGVQAEPPNIVLILADDLGWNDVGYHGSEIRTPRIDSLAEQGLTLDRFYAQSACSLTRAALMTGRAPLRLGVHGPISKHIRKGLPESEVTMADHFRAAGYQTALAGKWHLGIRDAYHPNNRGFDYFYGHVTGGIGYWDHVHGGGLDWQRNGETLREEGYATHLLADDIDRIVTGRDKDRPLFLYASFNAPHLPNEAPESAIEQYQGIEDPQRRIHAAMVTELDAAIGRLVDTLRREGMLDNTLIWFLSDNGGLNPSTIAPSRMAMIKQLVGMYGRPLPLPMLEFMRFNFEEGRGDNTPLRLGKRSLYEGGVRVPALVFWPGVIDSGVSGQMVTVQDVLPTMLEAAGITPEQVIEHDGHSQWAAIRGKKKHPVADYLAEAYEGIALYQFPWKLLSFKSGKQELYNVEEDPLETTDLMSQSPERIREMQAIIDQFPRGESIHAPRREIIDDPDFFGGREDRAPWSEI